MFKKITTKITNKLFTTHILNEDDIPIFHYCLESVLLLFSFLLVTLFLAYITDFLLPSLLFLIVFLTLRSVAGGFHAPTPEACFLLSILSFCIFRYISSIYHYHPIVMVIYILACIIIYFTAPIEAKQRCTRGN